MNYRELPDITERQKEIVDLVYQYRFINSKQLQRLFNHKDARRINTWLRDLVEKKYLGRIYSKKLLENTKPAIYYLMNNGIIWARYEMGMQYGAFNEQLDIKVIEGMVSKGYGLLEKTKQLIVRSYSSGKNSLTLWVSCNEEHFLQSDCAAALIPS